MKIIFDYNRTVFDPELNQLFGGAFEMLERLAKNHTLYLISMNEPGRSAVLEDLGIKHFFERIVFVNVKTEEAFVGLVGSTTDVLVVGDRVKDEIRIGNALGFVTIWVQQGKFGKEIPASEQEEPNYTINTITDLEEILSRHEK